MNHHGRQPELIEAEIARTRTAMDVTLHAIERRLTPSQLVDRGFDYLRSSGGSEFITNLGNSVKTHPMPVTLTGVALAWLMLSGRQSAVSEEPGGRSLSEAADSAREKISETTRKLSETKQKIAEGTSTMRTKLSGATSGAKDRAAAIAGNARDRMQRAGNGFQTLLHEQPLALAALGIAVGAIVAASIPRTRKEDELMGEASDHLADQAREVGKEQLDKAQRVVAAAGSAAVGEAKSPGDSQKVPAATATSAP
jgi:hypothetical protein